MLFLDNGSSFFFLLTIALTSRHEEKRSSWLLLLAGVSASLSVLCKEVGVYSILYILLYLVSLRKPLKDYKALVLALGIASVYPISGLIINKNLFLAVVTNEVNMANTTVFSPNSYKGLLNTSVHEFTYDANGFKMGDVSPLLLLAWVSLGFFLNSQNNKIVKLGAISFILTLVIMKYCWFQSWISMYPFFAIALAYSVKKILGYFADKLVKV
jgi:4-amino-4-deoxy-L-arabinose transferase-like glycosyltransferase